MWDNLKTVRHHPIAYGALWYLGWCIGATLLHWEHPVEGLAYGLSTGWPGTLVAVALNWRKRHPRQDK
jgi:hypothetical protein